MAGDQPRVSVRTTGQTIDDSRLIFAFAHDLRTHLRTVLLTLQFVQRGGAAMLPAEDQRMLQEAATAAGEINGLLNAMVAYCDVKAGDTLMNLRLLLQGVLIDLKATLANAGAEIETSNDLDVPVPVELHNVLKELLANACKFRDTGRPLGIRIATRLISDDTLEVTVADNGLGVAPVYLEKIFSPFQRLHSRDTFPGHGLGLAICRRTAAAWGGAINAEPGIEHGLTVRVTVPVDPA
jgi:signal transduction histidine kinase